MNIIENRHFIRSCTGIAILAVVFSALYFRGWFLLVALLVGSSLALWEFYSLFWQKSGRIRSRICALLLGAGMLVFSWLQEPQDALVFMGAAFVFSALSFLFRIDVIDSEEQENFAMGGIFLAGLTYIPLLLLPVTYLSSTKLFYVLIAVSASDITAYFVGTHFGRHKLWPRVSPKKSSEGALGSLVGCVLSCVLLGLWFGTASWWAYVLLGLLLNAFAQLGDLFESALKRSVNIKDSGSLLPGHGGMLDRIDSLLFALPVFAVVDQWFIFF